MIKSILTQLGKLFESEEQSPDLQNPQNTTVTFVLSHSSTTIGELSLKDGVWTFQYTSEFKAQQRLAPIVDFGDVNKLYESKILFPYFKYRIPSVSRPQIKQIIKEKNIDRDNVVELLKTFGQRSIVNPFELRLE